VTPGSGGGGTPRRSRRRRPRRARSGSSSPSRARRPGPRGQRLGSVRASRMNPPQETERERHERNRRRGTAIRQALAWQWNGPPLPLNIPLSAPHEVGRRRCIRGYPCARQAHGRSVLCRRGMLNNDCVARGARSTSHGTSGERWLFECATSPLPAVVHPDGGRVAALL
jgi:hypothetical protein